MADEILFTANSFLLSFGRAWPKFSVLQPFMISKASVRWELFGTNFARKGARNHSIIRVFRSIMIPCRGW